MDKTNLFLNKSNTMNHELNYFYNSNWENSMDHQNDPFESALSSIVSSPVTSNVMPSTSNGGDNFVLKELIGKLGSICNSSEMSPHSYINSTTNSCYTTPLNSPPRLNLSILDHQMNGNYVAQEFKESEFLDSRENSTVSEQIPLGEIGIKYQNDVNSKKKKSVPKRKARDTTAKVSTENNESNAKRSKSDEKNGSDNDVAEAAGDGNKKQNKDNEKPAEPPKDYIHVRARRGQATDAHSLAERVRREKIGERMKFLQDLVPGCNKVTGKAVMLDEIINYVQSLQRQVEFLSMKLATLDSRMDFNMESLVSKDLQMFQSVESLHHNMHPSEISAQGFPYGLIQSQQGPNGHMARNVRMQLPYMGGFVEQTPKVPTFFEDDLHSITQMGFGQIQPEIFPGNMSTAQMKVEL